MQEQELEAAIIEFFEFAAADFELSLREGFSAVTIWEKVCTGSNPKFFGDINDVKAALTKMMLNGTLSRQIHSAAFGHCCICGFPFQDAEFGRHDASYVQPGGEYCDSCQDSVTMSFIYRQEKHKSKLTTLYKFDANPKRNAIELN